MQKYNSKSQDTKDCSYNSKSWEEHKLRLHRLKYLTYIDCKIVIEMILFFFFKEIEMIPGDKL